MRRPAVLLATLVVMSLASTVLSGGGVLREAKTTRKDGSGGNEQMCTKETLRRNDSLDSLCKRNTPTFNDLPDTSILLKKALPHVANTAFATCNYDYLCADRPLKNMAANMLTRRGSMESLLRQATSPNSLPVSMSDYLTGFSVKDREEITPLVEHLFNHEDDTENPYCNDVAAQTLAKKATPLLLTAEGYDVPAQVTKLFEVILKGLLQASCPDVQAKRHLRKEGGVEDPVGERRFYAGKGASPGSGRTSASMVRSASMVGHSLSHIDKGMGGLNRLETEGIEATKEMFAWYVEKYNVDLDETDLIPDAIKPLYDRMMETITFEEETDKPQRKRVFGPLRWGEMNEPTCYCAPIESSLAANVLEQLDTVGVEIGQIRHNEHKFTSSNPVIAKVIEEVQPMNGHSDLEDLGRQVWLVENGGLRTEATLSNLMKVALKHLGEQPADGGVGSFENSILVKSALVMLPLVQNVWWKLDRLARCVDDAEYCREQHSYTGKLKWVLVLNIAWAVWHEMHKFGLGAMREEDVRTHHFNIALGLLTTALSMQGDFAWDPKVNLLRQTDDEKTIEWFIGLYTVWNYGFVHCTLSKHIRWPMLTTALGIPILESMTNHRNAETGLPTAAYWGNYRRDELMFAIVNGLKSRQGAYHVGFKTPGIDEEFNDRGRVLWKRRAKKDPPLPKREEGSQESSSSEHSPGDIDSTSTSYHSVALASREVVESHHPRRYQPET